MGVRSWLVHKINAWLTKDHDVSNIPLCDFDRISYEIKPGDVLLIEGRSRVSEVIKNITQSPWTHAALYIGRLHDYEDPILRNQIEQYYKGNPSDQLILEAMLGEGTVVKSLEHYKKDHIRICRPHGISRNDVRRVNAFAINRLGNDYDIRQLLDLARFMFPYGIVPRRWRSSLFQHNAGSPTRTVCSSLIAAAFASVHFPIMPVIQRSENGEMRLFRRNERLYTPRDFDYSPYFDIIKYPYLGFEDLAIYRKLPWDHKGRVCNDENDCFLPETIQPQNLTSTSSDPATSDTRRVGNVQQLHPEKTKNRSGVFSYPVSNLAVDLLKQEIHKKES